MGKISPLCQSQRGGRTTPGTTQTHEEKSRIQKLSITTRSEWPEKRCSSWTSGLIYTFRKGDNVSENIGKHVPHYVDTSVAVKLGVIEDGSERIKNYVKDNPAYSYHITEFAFYETLGVFKKKLDQKEIDRTRYDAAIITLITHLSEGLQIDADFRFDNWQVLNLLYAPILSPIA